jgi:hypothetical protein
MVSGATKNMDTTFAVGDKLVLGKRIYVSKQAGPPSDPRQ